MINKIYIKDYAIVRELELSFLNGFTVLTGETGAGKSLIVKALSLALGSGATFVGQTYTSAPIAFKISIISFREVKFLS